MSEHWSSRGNIHRSSAKLQCFREQVDVVHGVAKKLKQSLEVVGRRLRLQVVELIGERHLLWGWRYDQRHKEKEGMETTLCHGDTCKQSETRRGTDSVPPPDS